MSKVDSNNNYISFAVNPSGVATELLIDDLTGRLLVSIKAVSTMPGSQYKTIDSNNNYSKFAVDNNDNIAPILVDDDGYVWADLTIE